MSHYYKYKFVSPEPTFARVKEELKSYFDTGAVDDLMFPIWTNKCLQKLGRSSWAIQPALLFIDNFEAKLPPDFVAPREVWLTACVTPYEYRKPGAFYQQITTTLNKPYDACNPSVNCDPCNPDILTVVTKTNTNISHQFSLKYLLKPGTISIRKDCDQGCLNFSAEGPDTFDVRDGKLITNFRQGDVYLIYYSEQRDESGYQLVPENYRIQEFIEAFLKQKVFEQLYNQITDETFNQVERKYILYKQMADEAYIMADIEIKKKTIYEKAYAIRKDAHRLDGYVKDIYNDSWRWRGRGLPSSSWGMNN